MHVRGKRVGIKISIICVYPISQGSGYRMQLLGELENRQNRLWIKWLNIAAPIRSSLTAEEQRKTAQRRSSECHLPTSRVWCFLPSKKICHVA